MPNTRYRRGKLYAADMALYSIQMASDNSQEISRLKRNLSRALRQDITERQRQYMTMYYGQSMSMEAIARQLGVNKSTVSRTLKRGRQRLYHCLRYGAAALLGTLLRLPPALFRGALDRIPQDKKDEAVVSLIHHYAPAILTRAEAFAAGQGVSIRLEDLSAER